MTFPKSLLQVYSKTIDRSKVSEGQIAGDNRTDISFDNYYRTWIEGDILTIFFGLKEFKETGSSSWKSILVISGVLGFVLFISILFSQVIFTRNLMYLDIYLIAFISVFLLSIYQRLHVLFPSFMVIFYKRLIENSSSSEIDMDQIERL